MTLAPARYSFGADEHIFVELDEAMSLQAFFKGMAVTSALQRLAVPGVIEICPANASYLVRFDPDVVRPDELLQLLKSLEAVIGSAEVELETRIIEIPLFYNDPWTNETQTRFRERRQDPDASDLEYAARINNFASVDEFVAAHAGSPWFVSMVGFVAGLPWLYQMVERERQIEAPKYLRPRTDTPKLTIGHGGCFGCLYSVRGAGGYQMFGVTPAPIFDPEQKLAYFKEFMCCLRPGDIIKFRPIDREQYDRMLADVEAGRFDLRMRPARFSLKKFLVDPSAYNRGLEETLYGH